MPRSKFKRPPLVMLRKEAELSEDGRYRYTLTRVWDASLPVLVFVMLNPSTADAVHDDATVRRCLGFARAWKYGGILVVNLFALRTAHPGVLVGTRPSERVGEHNDLTIERAVKDRDVVVAWGVHGWIEDRDFHVMSILRPHAAVIDCLGLTVERMPKHPLYLAATVRRRPFAGRTPGELLPPTLKKHLRPPSARSA